MTKLTTERLEEIAKLEITEFSDGMDIAKDAYQSVGSSEIVLMARQLLAYEQAAKNPVAWVATDSEGFPEYNGHNEFSSSCGAGTPLYAAPVLPKQPDVTLTDEGNIPAQPVSEPYKLPVGYFSYGTEHGFNWHQTAKQATDDAEAMIDDYRGDACDGWSEETDNVCWGVILQQATKVDERPRTDDDYGDPAATTVCDYALLPAQESE